MRIWLVILVLAAALGYAPHSSASGPIASEPIILTYRPILLAGSNGFDQLQITLSFRGAASGITEIDLPHEWGGAVNLGRNISGLSVTGARLGVAASPHQRLLRHRPGARITLRYVVTGSDFLTKPILGQHGSAEYHPIIERDFFHVLGSTVVPRLPHLSGKTPVVFRMEGLPADARFASDLQHDGLTLAGVYQSVAVGGAFRLIEAGEMARLAVRGTFDNRDDAGWAESFARVAQSVEAYWKTSGGPYLVTVLGMAPPEPGWVSVGGTGLGDAFAFFTTSNADVDTLDRVMAHEKNHSWVPRRIGGVDPELDVESEGYWLSEGLTDFVTHRAMVRGGLWSPQRFVEQFNNDLAEYDRLSIRSMPNRESATLFWSSAEGQRLPYLRGMLFATWVDRELRRQSRGEVSLRDVLLAMQERAREGKMAGAAVVPATELFRREVVAAGLDLSGPLERFIDKGEPIELPDDILGPCGTFRSEERPVYELGFDGRKTAENGAVVQGVIEGSAAWRAGLRNGMRMIGRTAGTPGDSSSEATFEVESEGQRKSLTWIPAGTGLETRRRVIGDPVQSENCRAYLSM